MALIPRTGPLLAPANIANSRLGPPTRVFSSTSSSHSVEELPSGAGVSFDGAAFGPYEVSTSFDRGGGDRQQNFSHHPGRFNASTQAFTSMLEFEAGAEGGGSGVAGDSNSVRFPGLVSKAIAIYETNAKIGGGEINILGTSVSLVL